jgi:putative spermidine/putrescine transport system permease protein
MRLPGGLRASLTVITFVVLVVIYVPLLLVLLNSFNVDRSFRWPPPGYTTEWWELAWQSEGARDALWTSVRVALVATVIALALGTLAAMGLRRTRFFGRNVVSLLIILPIALPGIVTGLAFQNGFRTIMGVSLSLWTIIIAHATFCIVTVFNNVQARFARLGSNFEQASMDLGAGPFTTFRLITLPMLRSALLAGALLSFGLSFDEIVVTQFTASATDRTLPIWIFQNLFRPNQAPIVNCVAAALVLFSTIPIYLAQRLSGNATEAMTGAR